MKHGKLDILQRIDRDCKSVYGVRSGAARYAGLMTEISKIENIETEKDLLKYEVKEMSAISYRRQVRVDVEL